MLQGRAIRAHRALVAVLAVLPILMAGPAVSVGATSASEDAQLTEDPTAATMCALGLDAERSFGPGTVLIRSEMSTAAQVAAWQELRHGPDITGLVSPLRAFDADEPVAVCLYSGTFSTPTGPPNLDGSPKPNHNVIRLLFLRDGSEIFDSAGYAPGTPGYTGGDIMQTPQDWLEGQGS